MAFAQSTYFWMFGQCSLRILHDITIKKQNGERAAIRTHKGGVASRPRNRKGVPVKRQSKVRVTGIEKPEPNIRLFVLALIELARELQNGRDTSVEVSGFETEEEGER